MIEAPAHWEVLRLKTCASNIVEQLPVGSFGGRGLALESVESWTGRIRDGAPLEGVVKRFQRGDVLFGKLRPYLAKVARPEQDGVCVGEFLVLRPRGGCLDATFMAHLMRSKPIIEAVNASAFGARMPRAEWDFIGAMRVPVPPRAEQEAIACFLDHADQRIRSAIRAKEKLIALLNDQKRSLIQQAVTRGLNPTARLKDSGVEWMGEVPAHWHVARIKEVARMESGHTPSRGNSDHWLDDNDIPWVSLNDTKQLERVDYISDTALHVNSLGLQNSSARLLPAGAVVFTRDAAVGKAAITTRPMAVSQHLIAWICGPELLNSYLLRVIYAMRDELRRFTLGATIPTIGMDDIRSLVTPLPPLEEQKAIADRIEADCSRVERCLGLVRREIDTINEYRTRLAADVVTGELDMREAAEQLSDAPDEPRLESTDEHEDESEGGDMEAVEA